MVETKFVHICFVIFPHDDHEKLLRVICLLQKYCKRYMYQYEIGDHRGKHIQGYCELFEEKDRRWIKGHLFTKEEFTNHFEKCRNVAHMLHYNSKPHAGCQCDDCMKERRIPTQVADTLEFWPNREAFPDFNDFVYDPVKAKVNVRSEMDQVMQGQKRWRECRSLDHHDRAVRLRQAIHDEAIAPKEIPQFHSVDPPDDVFYIPGRDCSLYNGQTSVYVPASETEFYYKLFNQYGKKVLPAKFSTVYSLVKDVYFELNAYTYYVTSRSN